MKSMGLLSIKDLAARWSVSAKRAMRENPPNALAYEVFLPGRTSNRRTAGQFRAICLTVPCLEPFLMGNTQCVRHGARTDL